MSLLHKMPKLTTQKCAPCEGGVKPFTSKEFTPLLAQVKRWKVINGHHLEREFHFRNFREALRFVNRIGAIAEREGHHPDMLLHGWNKVKITLFTHAINGLSRNDFIIAAKVGSFVEKSPRGK